MGSIDPAVTDGTILSNTATISSSVSDPTPGNNSTTQPTTIGGQPPGGGQPRLTAQKTASLFNDLNGNGFADPGDTLQYLVTVSNAVTATAAATGVIFSDTVPANTLYVPASLRILTGANAGPKTDNIGDDQAEAFLNSLTFRLGSGANATTGGTLAPGALTQLSFRVTIAPNVTPGTVITNQGIVRGDNFPPIVTDDPSSTGDDDPTRVPIGPTPPPGGGGGIVLPPPLTPPDEETPGLIPPIVPPEPEEPGGNLTEPECVDCCQPGDLLRGDERPNLIFASPDNDTIFGVDSDDSLYGLDCDDDIYGGNGNDLLFGNRGFDYLEGNEGDDSLYGGKDNDTLRGGNGNDLLFGNRDNDTLSGDDGDDSLYGGKGRDQLIGGRGNDFLTGDLGDDILIGVEIFPNNQPAGVGEIDTLIGGEGTDIFALGDRLRVFYSGEGAADYALITDFNPGEDFIRLQAGRNYSIGPAPEGTPEGWGIFVDGAELIGVVEGNLAPDQITARFLFVQLSGQITSSNTV